MACCAGCSRRPDGLLAPGRRDSHPAQWQLNLLNVTLTIAFGSSKGSPTDVTWSTLFKSTSVPWSPAAEPLNVNVEVTIPLRFELPPTGREPASEALPLSRPGNHVGLRLLVEVRLSIAVRVGKQHGTADTVPVLVDVKCPPFLFSLKCSSR